jgi:enoyl-CoA hydratase/3-hydroxyacyl-CoA dehydrogenase
VAGADVKFFVDKIRADAVVDIESFTTFGHEVLGRLENSPKTTIAATTGLALGGGLELALACDYRIGTRRTQFRFPETSIGIYPGLGGTQRTPRICGAELARWAVLGGNWIDAQTAADIGLLTHLVDPSDVNRSITEIAATGKPTQKYPGAPTNVTPLVQAALSFYSEENMPLLLAGALPEGIDADDKFVGLQLKLLSRTAPIATSIANELIGIAAAEPEDIAAGLQSELDRLDQIFSTEDALEGLSALIEGRRPTYSGC